LQTQSALPKNLVLYGLEATGKSTITQAILRSLSSHNLNEVPEGDPQDNLLYAIINSTECISGRHLLEQTVGAVTKLVDWNGPVPRCENLSQLVVELGRFLESWTTNTSEDRRQRLVLVFDGIDNQREAPPTLLPALARLGEVVSIPPSIVIRS
jgi:origin recognition complex subunit 5